MTGSESKNVIQSHAPVFWQKGLMQANKAPRCHAKSKRSGRRCRQAAVKGKCVCRMHGGNAGAPKGNKNRLVHGRYTAEAIANRREMGSLIRSLKAFICADS